MSTASATSTLRVVPATSRQLELLIDDPDRFTREFGWTVAAGYVEFDGALEHARDALAAGVPAGWSTHLFVHEPDRTVVGIGGYTGPPQEGSVEIGYAIAPGYRRAGLATQAARQLVARAVAEGVDVVVAHTLAAPGPSTRVLERLGFTRVAEYDDPDDGKVWRWQRRSGADASQAGGPAPV